MKTQSGRSMIEIIGVLAVMGILSIAVLYLYPYLVAHHKSNETWNDVLVQATVVQTSHTDDTFADIEIVDGEELPSLITSEEFETSAVGYPMEVYKTNDVQFIVQVDNVDYDACEIMLKKHSLVPDAIEVGNVKFEPIQENYDICGTSGTKTMYFYFGFCNGDINAVCDGGCGENFECFCGRCWCPIVGADAQTCQCPKNYEVIKGECVCPTGDLTTEDVCCPKGEHADGEICCEDGQYNSKGFCCPDGWLDDEKQHRLWIADDEDKGKCKCQRVCDNNDLIPNADCTACVCGKTCDNGFVLNETNCTCVCPKDKPYSYDGQCNVCPKDKPYSYDGRCNVCPEDKPYSYNEQCNVCPKDKPYSYDGQCNVCPTGQTYATASKMCCPVGQKVDKNGVCCATSQYSQASNLCMPASCLPKKTTRFTGNGPDAYFREAQNLCGGTGSGFYCHFTGEKADDKGAYYTNATCRPTSEIKTFKKDGIYVVHLEETKTKIAGLYYASYASWCFEKGKKIHRDKKRYAQSSFFTNHHAGEKIDGSHRYLTSHTYSGKPKYLCSWSSSDDECKSSSSYMLGKRSYKVYHWAFCSD